MTAQDPQDPDRLRLWLALLHAPGLGPIRIGAALAGGADPARLVAEPPADWPASARDFLRRPEAAALDADLAWAARPDRHILTLEHPAYPRLLAEIPDPPPLLFVQGDPAVLGRLQLALVGSRNPTAGGARTARDFAAFLARAGLVITSGLALGIDAAAHEGALAAGRPTVAVTGTGLDRVYPARHHKLAHAIAEQGALVSEFPTGTPPRPEHFPRRNRIISGLSLGVLVVEAAVRSGSLITARLAAEQGREVFAIPGSIHNPLARGCHALIRQGAKLVETAGVAAQGGAPEAPETGPPTLDADHLGLLESLGYDAVSVDELVRRSGLTAEAVSSMLLILELEGYVVPAPGGRYARTEKRG